MVLCSVLFYHRGPREKAKREERKIFSSRFAPLRSLPSWSPVIKQNTAKPHVQSVKMALTEDLTPQNNALSVSVHSMFLIAHELSRSFDWAKWQLSRK